MSEPAVEWDLPAEDVRVADFRAKVRAAGERWTGRRPGELVEVLAEAAAGDPELAELVRAGGSVLEDFLDGYRRRLGAERTAAAPRDLAGDLVDGRDIAPELFAGLAARYLIAVVRFSDAGAGKSALHEVVGPGVLRTQRECGLVLLVPDADPERITQQFAQCLAGTGWLAFAERPKSQIADGCTEAVDVLRLVVAGRRPGGVYSLSDVLVEYAVTRHERIADNLVAVIEPLRAHTALWETLTVLIDADYSRNKAARDLFIHRSTLDYRLQRIAAITGCDPTSGRGAQLLTAAMIADAVTAPH